MITRIRGMVPTIGGRVCGALNTAIGHRSAKLRAASNLDALHHHADGTSGSGSLLTASKALH